MSLRPIISFSFAVVTLTALAGIATSRTAHALGWFDQRNYMRCIEYATADAADSPAGPGRDAVYQAARKACYQTFFLDRLGMNH